MIDKQYNTKMISIAPW